MNHSLSRNKTVARSSPGKARRGRIKQILFIVTLLVLLLVAYLQITRRPKDANAALPTYGFQVVNTWPHDRTAFTQGLVFHDGTLYEGTGLNGSSSLRKVDLVTGQVLKSISVPEQYFGEGIALFQGRVFQLTWQSQKAFVYDPGSFDKLSEFSYTGEGWGLTNDDRSLIMSDGTNQIRFIDPDTFQVQRTIAVTRGDRPVKNLNELEFVRGEIYSNVWQTDKIVRIDPQTGKLLGVIDLTGLLHPEDRDSSTDVLNGIAYDDKNDRLFVTGKLWPKLFEIRLVKK
jgi:glutamine cyclotransferase